MLSVLLIENIVDNIRTANKASNDLSTGDFIISNLSPLMVFIPHKTSKMIVAMTINVSLIEGIKFRSNRKKENWY